MLTPAAKDNWSVRKSPDSPTWEPAGLEGIFFCSFLFCCVFKLDQLLHALHAAEPASLDFVLFKWWGENKETNGFQFLWSASEGSKRSEGFEARPRNVEVGDIIRVVLGGWRGLFTYIWMIVCLHLTQTWYSEMASSSWKIVMTCTLFQIHGCCKIPLSLSLCFGLQSLTATGTKQNVSYWLAEEWFDTSLVACSNASFCSRFFFSSLLS